MDLCLLCGHVETIESVVGYVANGVEMNQLEVMMWEQKCTTKVKGDHTEDSLEKLYF